MNEPKQTCERRWEVNSLSRLYVQDSNWEMEELVDLSYLYSNHNYKTKEKVKVQALFLKSNQEQLVRFFFNI